MTLSVESVMGNKSVAVHLKYTYDGFRERNMYLSHESKVILLLINQLNPKNKQNILYRDQLKGHMKANLS